jgi:hypothetical protein
MRDNNIEGQNLGGGVVIFRSAIDLDWSYTFDLCTEVIEREKALMYAPGFDPETGKEVYINKSGYFFSKDSIDMMPRRGSAVHQDTRPEVINFLNFLEKTKDSYLFKYFEFYPLAFKCVWWKVKGHIVSYKKSVYLGSHSDISTDYTYGVWTPDNQLAMRSTVTSLVYFNDSVDSVEELNGKNYTEGHHYFNYLDLDIKPKKGDILFFPAGYTAAHEVKSVGEGIRYSYLGWYSQGTPNPEVGESVVDPAKEPELAQHSTNTYMPTYIEDYRNHLKMRGYSEFSDQYKVTLPGY